MYRQCSSTLASSKSHRGAPFASEPSHHKFPRTQRLDYMYICSQNWQDIHVGRDQPLSTMPRRNWLSSPSPLDLTGVRTTHGSPVQGARSPGRQQNFRSTIPTVPLLGHLHKPPPPHPFVPALLLIDSETSGHRTCHCVDPPSVIQTL